MTVPTIALDVGTRSIVCAEHRDGVIARLCVTEHALPCMREGAVHDLSAAVDSIRRVREAMELPRGCAAAVAIAGGSLTTRVLSVSLDGPGPWTQADLEAADAKALQHAAHTKQLAGRALLGVTRSEFRRDGRPAGSLVGLEGKRADYRLLATWLPLENIHIKLRAIEEAGFRATRITVEPIAVGRALFGLMPPPGLFAVIDIGAGTSEIALLSPDGLAGVASIPLAGDTITEVLARRLGLSYLAADRVKRDPESPVVDLWGAKKAWTAREIRREAEEGSRRLVDGIAEGLRALDPEKRLDGVILVGGGSLWPPLAGDLAEAIGISEERVRVRPSETVPGIEDRSGLMKGPSFLTVLGIILSNADAFRISRCDVNGRESLQLLPPSLKRTPTVAEAIEAAGMDPLDFFGAPGAALVASGTIAGGGPGGDPVIQIDGAPGSLDSPASGGASITISKGRAGEDAKSEAPEITASAVESMPRVSAPRAIESRGREHPPDTPSERPPVVPQPISVPLRARVPLPIERGIAIRLDGRETLIHDRTTSAIVNGTRMRADAVVPHDAVISTERGPWRVYEALGELGRLPRKILLNGREAGLLAAIKSGDAVTTS